MGFERGTEARRRDTQDVISLRLCWYLSQSGGVVMLMSVSLRLGHASTVPGSGIKPFVSRLNDITTQTRACSASDLSMISSMINASNVPTPELVR